MTSPSSGSAPAPDANTASASPTNGSATTANGRRVTTIMPLDYLQVLVDSKDARLVLDEDILFLFRGSVNVGELRWSESLVGQVVVAVPHFLVLNTSVVDDSDGATILIRVLAPRPGSAKVNAWLKRRFLSSHSTPPVKGSVKSSGKSNVLYTGDEQVRTLLNGPFAKLRLVTIEARVAPNEVDKATQFSKKCFDLAYVSPVTGQKIHPYRKLRVLVNPHGGPGKARQEWDGKIRPILEAAGCQLNTTITTHRNHGLEIVLTESDLTEKYDGILSVSGDGMMHEILNGLAARADAEDVLGKIAVVPIPTGSGNAMSVSLLGPTQGFNLAQAALNAIKGHWLDMEICVLTQPAGEAGKSPHLKSMLDLVRSKSVSPGEVSRVERDEQQGFVRYYSFLSQAVGLMADLDIGTEHLRMLGDTRFVYGYLHGLVVNDQTPVTVDVKLGLSGTVNKQEMRKQVEAQQASASHGHQSWPEMEEENDLETRRATDQTVPTSGKGEVILRCGTVLDDLGGDALPDLDLEDPSWSKSRAYAGGKLKPASEGAKEGWARMRKPISSLYAGKLPYVARDLLQFPYAIAGDHLVDVALMMHDGRMAKIRALNGAETGEVVYDKGIAYIKVQAFRVTPNLPAGHSKLKKGGIISIDGERVPYAPFQVEVAPNAQLRTFSLYGNFFMQHHWPASA